MPISTGAGDPAMMTAFRQRRSYHKKSAEFFLNYCDLFHRKIAFFLSGNEPIDPPTFFSRTTDIPTMSRCIIFHSYSGITRGVARKVRAACGGDLIEVKPKKNYNALTVYPLGGYRAMMPQFKKDEGKKTPKKAAKKR